MTAMHSMFGQGGKRLLSLCALATLLAMVLAVECAGWRPMPAATGLAANPRAPELAVTAPALANPAPQAGAAQKLVGTILSRPLFQLSRRPPPQADSPIAAGPAGLPRLTGVMASGLTKRLIFAPGPDGKPVVVTVGGHIGAYVVQSIGVGEAVVTGPEGSKTLHPAFNATDINTPSGMVANGSNERNALLELMRNGGTMPAMGNGAFGARSAAASPNAPSVTRAGSPTASPSHATTPGIQP